MIPAISPIETQRLGDAVLKSGLPVSADDGFSEALRQVRERMEQGEIPVAASSAPIAPAGTVQTVRPGDTLSEICRDRLKSAGLRCDSAEIYRAVDAVARLNRISDPDNIKTGQRIDLSPVSATAKSFVAKEKPDCGTPWAGIVADGAELSSGYGLRRDPFTRQISRHEGIDLACPTGTPVYALTDGKVSFSGWQPGYGRVVKLSHADGSETVYAHASRLNVRAGDSVAAGEQIAAVGSSGRSTGAHLHFEVRRGGGSVDPISYLAEHGAGRLANLER